VLEMMRKTEIRRHETHIEHQKVTGTLHNVPDKQYDTALTAPMKSHPGFHPGNLLHALAWRRPPAASSFLILVRVVNHQGTNPDILQTSGSMRFFGFSWHIAVNGVIDVSVVNPAMSSGLGVPRWRVSQM
jgi:hypothetical protein